MLQYRDLFDNHGPIFHLLCVPLFRALGERADILVLMRLGMIPLLGVALWCVYRIGANVFSKKAGIWAAIFTGLYPEFFFTSTEFRTDDLWTVLWLASLVIATAGGLSGRRSFLIGLLLGAAFGVTVKTGLMVGAVSFAALWIIGYQWAAGQTLNWRRISAFASAGLLGLLIVPAALVLFFASQGASNEFLYCNIFHNLVPHAQNWERFDAHVLWFPIFAVISLGVFIRLGRRRIEPRIFLAIFLTLVAGSYFTALKTFFPTLSRQDDLPFIPLLVLLITALISGAMISLPTRTRDFFARFAPLIALAEALSILLTVPIQKDRTREDIAMVAGVLRATKPSEFVMDATGEAIFRRRPFYYVIEAFTRARIQQGSIKDEIVEKMIERGTILARPEGLPKMSREFIRQNYLPIGNGLFMLGKALEIPSNQTTVGPIAFDVLVPARYSIVGENGPLAGCTLDWEALTSSRFLQAGKHLLQMNSIQIGSVALFSADGVERGISPFENKVPPMSAH